jgi:predicted Abi (CAAX) family protease
MTMARMRLRSVWLGLRTWPDRRAWLRCGGIFVIYAAIAAALGALSGFFRPGLPDWPAWKLILLPLVLLITPALGEELFFRALPLPHPDEAATRRHRLFASALALVAFVLWHPLNGLWTPRVWPVFTDPVFLMLAALLGVACTLAYLASGSIWPPVLIHWSTVVVWGLLLGGREMLGT